MPSLVLLASLLFAAQQMPTSIDVPARAHLLFTLKGIGTQNYVCIDHHWSFQSPQADLQDADSKIVGSHSSGPIWQLKDGSEVKGKVVAGKTADDAASVPWLLLQALPGTGKGRFAQVTYIRRTETQGGAAPAESCSDGSKSVAYTATYSFYTGQ